MLLLKGTERIVDCYSENSAPSHLCPSLALASCPSTSNWATTYSWDHIIPILILVNSSMSLSLHLKTCPVLYTSRTRFLALNYSSSVSIRSGPWDLPMFLGCDLLARSLVCWHMIPPPAFIGLPWGYLPGHYLAAPQHFTIRSLLQSWPSTLPCPMFTHPELSSTYLGLSMTLNPIIASLCAPNPTRRQPGHNMRWRTWTTQGIHSLFSQSLTHLLISFFMTWIPE